MTFSLIRFLEVNYIMLICFPSLGYLLCTNGNDKENFSRTFCTNFVNILVFTYFLYPTNFSFIFYPSFNFITLVWIVTSSVLCLSIDFGLYYVLYRKLKISVVSQKKFSIIILVIVLIPLMEEVLFRGLLCSALKLITYNRAIYVLLSSIAFSLNHIIYPKHNVFSKFLWGIILGCAYVITGNIVVPITSHIINNLVIYWIGYVQNKKNGGIK